MKYLHFNSEAELNEFRLCWREEEELLPTRSTERRRRGGGETPHDPAEGQEHKAAWWEGLRRTGGKEVGKRMRTRWRRGEEEGATQVTLADGLDSD